MNSRINFKKATTISKNSNYISTLTGNGGIQDNEVYEDYDDKFERFENDLIQSNSQFPQIFNKLIDNS